MSAPVKRRRPSRNPSASYHPNPNIQLTLDGALNLEGAEAVAAAEAIVRQPLEPIPQDVIDALAELREAFGPLPEAETLRLYRAYEMGRITAILEAGAEAGEFTATRNHEGVRVWAVRR